MEGSQDQKPADELGPRSAQGSRGILYSLRGVCVFVVGWLFLMVICLAFSLFALITLRWGVRSYMHKISRFAGSTVLWLVGIKLRVHGAEHIAGRKARLLVLNHTSQLDLFIFAALMPEAGTVLGKRELLFVPFVGWFIWSIRTIFINRRKRSQAHSSLDEAARVVVAHRATLLIAPEGTRSRTGKLGPFKMGLFHLALASRAPIVPVVVKGARLCQPMGQLIPHPGTIEVTFLPEVSTADYTAENLKQQRDALRAMFCEQLGQEA